jgi:HSP20 family protein
LQLREAAMTGLTIWMNQELSKLKKELDVLYDRMCRDYGMPSLLSGGGSLDVSETDEKVLIKATLPDLDPEDLDLTITEDVLTIQGRSTRTVERGEKTLERAGSFRSSMKLHCKIEVDQIKASYKEGVLEITLPKCPPPLSKRLKITS